MKILFLTENFPPEVNASASRVYERACYWHAWGHDITVVTTAPNFPDGKLFPGYRNGWYSVEQISGIRVVRVKSLIFANRGIALRMLDFLSFLFTGAAAGLFQQRPDVVAATSPQFFAAVAGFLVAKCRRAPFVFELGDLWPASIVAVGAMRPNLGLRLMEKFELYLYRHSARVLALTSSFKADLIRRGISSEKVSVALNGVDLSRYEPRDKDPELVASYDLAGKFVVGYIGTHGMAHALETLVEAAQLIERQCPEVRFLFVGAGAAREQVEREVRRLKLANVVLVPRQPKDKIARFWSLCDCTIIPLRNQPVFEGVIPSKMFEAMGMGIPIVMAVPPGEATSILERESAGICIPPESPAALAAGVLRLRNDDSLRRQLASNAVAAAPRYSREAQARKTLEILESAAGLAALAADRSRGL